MYAKKIFAMIPVSKPYLPPIEKYLAQVKRAYDNEWLTNRGELVNELELKIKNFLNTSANLILMSNGTVPIQIALNVLGKGGEIITTPFSYVATTNSIIWESCKPVFVDIDPIYWTIDEKKIENVITKNTTCILATHVFGNPCNVEEIQRIAEKYNLYVIYDAAHAFGVSYKGESIFNWGDLSTCSFHATKIFHTAEGGAAFINSDRLYKKIFYAHNFGHNGPNDFHCVGINGKMSELQAAMGISVLESIAEIFKFRKEVFMYYYEKLVQDFQLISIRNNVEWNYSYFPIVFRSEKDLHRTKDALEKLQISTRRYFYPSLNKLGYLENKTTCQYSEDLSDRILVLPMYHLIDFKTLDIIVKTIKNF